MVIFHSYVKLPEGNHYTHLLFFALQDIGYITDIEGDLETFNRYVDSDASVLRRENGVLKLTLGLPTLVNIQKTMEKSTIFDFDG